MGGRLVFSIATFFGPSHFAAEVHQLPKPETIMNYQTPRLEVFGRVEELTRASGNPNLQDSIFLNGVLVGNLTGSLDACVSNDPQNPTGTCDATP